MTTATGRTEASVFEQRCTYATLAEFARAFKRQPYAIYRGVCYEPLFWGPSETPAYRRSAGMSDPGEIVTTWPDGRVFESQVERDGACVADAAAEDLDDPTRHQALAFVREASERAVKGAARHARGGARWARAE